ncbi:uncharacterized protein CDAR_311221 [Caerostris darwini]|uniref:Uncharacterized protein n=1 Tax=Caerostris darwini TaxID=1538125 RepID=A0AAV4WVJ0_9ARAC|nr:uncharacterized protein CDAR_311221 [Caerostris darwini]
MSATSLQSAEILDKQLHETFFKNCSDVFKEILHDHDLVEPLRRQIIVGHIEYSNRATVEEEYIEHLKDIEKDIQDDVSRISGILIIHERFFYHVCESTDEVLNDIIAATANLVATKTILGAKVIRNCGIVQRYFSYWSSCIVRTPNYKDQNEELKTLDEERGVFALAQMIKKLGDAIFVLASFLRFVEPRNFKEKINELVPIGVLLFRNELEDLYTEKFFLTVEQRVAMYQKKKAYTSFTELEWPPTGPIHDPEIFFDELKSYEEEIDEALALDEEQKKAKAKPGTFWWTVKTTK